MKLKDKTVVVTGAASGIGKDLCEAFHAEGAATVLILPHPEVLTYLQRKTADYDRWLSGMRRFRDRFNEFKGAD